MSSTAMALVIGGGERKASLSLIGPVNIAIDRSIIVLLQLAVSLPFHAKLGAIVLMLIAPPTAFACKRALRSLGPRPATHREYPECPGMVVFADAVEVKRDALSPRPAVDEMRPQLDEAEISAGRDPA